MITFRTRLAHLTVASTLVLGLGALGAGPATASYSSGAGSITDSTMSSDAPTPTGIGKPGGFK